MHTHACMDGCTHTHTHARTHARTHPPMDINMNHLRDKQASLHLEYRQRKLHLTQDILSLEAGPAVLRLCGMRLIDPQVTMVTANNDLI